jgi:hydroxypyruvate isomerase
MQLTDGNLAETLRQTIGLVRHLQIASVPGRNEPHLGEINYPYLFDLIDSLGYDGSAANTSLRPQLWPG